MTLIFLPFILLILYFLYCFITATDPLSFFEDPERESYLASVAWYGKEWPYDKK